MYSAVRDCVDMIPDFMILESPTQKVVRHNDMENPGGVSLDDSQSVRASMYMDSGAAKLTGHNDMEKPGDANLDGENTIIDVIAVNKQILGVGMLDKTGVYADYSGVNKNGQNVGGRVHVVCIGKKLYVLELSWPKAYTETYKDTVYKQFRHSVKITK